MNSVTRVVLLIACAVPAFAQEPTGQTRNALPGVLPELQPAIAKTKPTTNTVIMAAGQGKAAKVRGQIQTAPSDTGSVRALVVAAPVPSQQNGQQKKRAPKA